MKPLTTNITTNLQGARVRGHVVPSSRRFVLAAL
ncbi:MAG: hypothetical protein JWM31_1763 [Solirubrobacterales bacterium]|nr:hypothetical protein [Solirubrobacterales bacterium]